MCKPMYQRTMLSTTLLLGLMAPQRAHAQFGDPLHLPAELLRQQADEWWLRHDQARLQNDINRGDTASVNRDLNRLQSDERRLWRDRRWIRRDLFLPPGPYPTRPQSIPADAVLIPHPLYPGYGYYSNNPTQLYQLPQATSSGGAQPAPQPATVPVSSSEPASARNPVVIVNGGPLGTAIHYAIDGVDHQVGSGQHEILTVSPTSTIRYQRDGSGGEQRYCLSPGVYEFRLTGAAWALFKLPSGPLHDASPSLSAVVPMNELPARPRAGDAVGSEGSGVKPQR